MSSPENKQRVPSPIKVKDYFTNPLHKIKQPAFTEVGFTVSALNTFVKNFTNRSNSKFINLQEIRNYIKRFTNNNAKLIQMYEDFFLKNFKVQHFVQFFVKQTKKDDLAVQNIRKIYQDISPFNVENLLKRANYLQIPLTQQQANKIVKMINYKYGSSGNQVSFDNFYSALKDSK